jgi:hypothetical protein
VALVLVLVLVEGRGEEEEGVVTHRKNKQGCQAERGREVLDC